MRHRAGTAFRLKTNEELTGHSTKNERVAKRVRGPGRKTLALREHVLEVFDSFEGSMSTRQVFYQLVSRGAVANDPKMYEGVSRLLVAMRRDGSVPYSRVVDRTRSKHHRIGWDGCSDIMSNVAVQYRRNLWAQQDVHVHVCCEKQALEGIFAEVVDSFGAPLWVIRGFSSESFVYEWAEEIRELVNDGREVVVAYFGDHDPSGLCIEENTRSRLHNLGARFEWYRVGLVLEDFDVFDLVNVPVKRTDSRATKYLERFGDRGAELDALPPDELRNRIRDAIAEHVDVDAWERLKNAEKQEREALGLVTANWAAALAGAKGAA